MEVTTVAADGVTGVLPIALYVIERHPLQASNGKPPFRWLGDPAAVEGDLDDLIGSHDPELVSVLVDERPGGPAWNRLLEGLLAGEIQVVVTHLAPLTSAQRQQLIAISADTGAQLITPGDAGRNRASD